MQHTSTYKFDRTNALIATAVWLATLSVYMLTKAPTLSLWDCGEFIATSCILGIPHPPGTPLYIMFGRIFSIIPLFADVATRVNFLSSLTASIAALFGYLCGVRLLRIWFRGDGSRYGRILLYAGSACGALFLALGRTEWTNATEAEVYGMAMMLMMAILWLTLLYFDKRGTPAAGRILLAIVYLAFLGIGVHMTTLLVLPACAFVFVLKDGTPVRYWFILAALYLMELYLVFALSSPPVSVPFYVPIVIVFIFHLFYTLSFERVPRPALVMALGFAFSCAPLLGLVSPALAGPATVFGVVCFVLTLLYAVYITRQYLRQRGPGEPVFRDVMPGALLVFAAAFMTLLLLSGLKGYGAFLVLSFVLLVATAAVIWRYVNLPILLALVAALMIILGVLPFFYGIGIAVLVILVLGLGYRVRGAATALLVILAAVLGFSVHLYVPIRSAQDPYINENNPSQDLTSTINFLERKQYGLESMFERMFTRRGEWGNQFGMHRRMGFWSFFQEQYGLSGRKFFLLFVIGLFGIWEVVRRRSETGLLFMILLLVTSVGLILYMNFADGTRQVGLRDYLEVRDRDYFFSPAYMLFGLAIGLGWAAVVQFLRELVARYTPSVRRTVLAAGLVVFLTPAYALAVNWHVCDRSNDFIPYDYAWNLLSSADENAVLFTNADNDTFPLWCLQEAYGVRKDVKVVNLALANSKWYIKQLRDYMHLELGWTEREIDALIPYRLRDGRSFRVQDLVIDAVIDHNPDIPVNFCITLVGSARTYHGQQADSLLTLSGMKFRLDRDKTRFTVDREETLAYFRDSTRFRYKSFADPTIYKNETTLRTVSNVANSLIMSAESFRLGEMYVEAEELARLALQIRPGSGRLVNALGQVFAARGEIDSIVALLGRYPDGDLRELRLSLARAYRQIERPQEAWLILDRLLSTSPSYHPALDEIIRLLLREQDAGKMVSVLERWLYYNPDDTEIRAALDGLLLQLESLSGGGQRDSQ
ncbi:MAG TPA: DUF2723 domain-containing protein [Acidobacteriota bacterium]|nr:DUF2723 domain-containing protein [Acidobacteriota bacterium]